MHVWGEKRRRWKSVTEYPGHVTQKGEREQGEQGPKNESLTQEVQRIARGLPAAETRPGHRQIKQQNFQLL